MSRSRLVALFFCSLGLAAGAFVIGRWTAAPGLTLAEAGERARRETQRADALNTPAGTTSLTPLVRSASAQSAEWARRVAQPAASLAAEEERQRMIEQWAEVDPQAALAFARSQLSGDRRAQAVSSVIAIWGKNDPAGAWGWVGRETPEATYHFDTLLEVFGKQSTELAARYAAEFASTHPDAAIEANLAALMGVTYRGDFAGGLDFIRRNALLDPTLRANLNNFLAGQWGRVAPTRAAEWVMSLPEGAERAQALIGLGESWSEVDPAAAAAFAASLPEGESRSLAVRQAVAKWVSADAPAARDWVMKTNATQDFDTALQAVATQNNFMSREPAHAMVWATGIFNEQLRTKTISTVLFNWYMIDQKAATNYLMSSTEFTPEQRSDLLKKLQPTQENGGAARVGAAGS